VSAEHFKHPWGQHSIIATIPGKTNSTVVVGAHQDSINLWLPSVLPAPGADDDGSGTVTILEAFRVLLQSEDIVKGKHENTLEFHWYSAEEGGLLGSQAIFHEYAKQGRDVKAMLQQDMTGFVTLTLEAGLAESVGVVVDHVDPNLTEFIKKVIVAVCWIPRILRFAALTWLYSIATSLTSRPNVDTPAQTTPLRPRLGILRRSLSRLPLSTRITTFTARMM
jgi:leucyl aminopeptidase